MTHLLPVLALAAAMVAGEAPQAGPAAEQAPPARVILGVDCREPLMVSLPDDVLTECEGEAR
ncbi:MAG: hypothetical protein OXK73_02785 [Rhodospirillaceae bacterium]|nr:hypothetical protein [Rhodospirillaceae bacterium]MDE0360235.1 hypothetical protein [Rhodospirillaceae bacterium]